MHGRYVVACVAITAILTCGSGDRASAAPLPEGNNGIAARYPGDVAITSDPAVIFADDFESYANASAITTKWDQGYHNLRIATEPGNFYAGAKALEFTVPKQSDEMSNTVIKYVKPTVDTLFLRFYAKFAPGFNVIGSSHNGAGMASSYWDGPGSGPGIPADGYNKFFVSYEFGRFDNSVPNPGQLNVYVYHPDQRDVYGDHFFPTGEVSPCTSCPFDWGPDFVPRPHIVPPLGQWNCYELMVKANTPGKRDARIALWMDGKLVADFQNFRLRETTNLKIDQFDISLHVKSNTLAVAKKWYDNVVAATSYIGPLVSTSTARDAAGVARDARTTNQRDTGAASSGDLAAAGDALAPVRGSDGCSCRCASEPVLAPLALGLLVLLACAHRRSRRGQR